MQLRVIGSSPAWPNPGRAHSGVLLEDGWPATRLLVDCGPGVLARLRRDELLPVDAIVITHFHLDHFGDLVPWCWFARHACPPGGNRCRLHVPAGGGNALAGFADRFGTPWMFDGVFAIEEYAAGERFETAGFSVEPIGVDHYGLCAHGLRVRGPGGRVVAFSGDSGPTPALTELARGADLFVCEATLPDDHAEGPERGHLSAAEAIAAAAGTRLLLTHRPIELAPPPGIQVADDGTLVDLP